MSKVMLDCERATSYVMRADLEKIGCVKHVQLRLHLMGCRFCREFVRQYKWINRELDGFRQIDPENPIVQLDELQRKRLAHTLEPKG